MMKTKKRMNNLRVSNNTLDVIKGNCTNKLVPWETLFVCLFPMCPFLASCQCTMFQLTSSRISSF